MPLDKGQRIARDYEEARSSASQVMSLVKPRNAKGEGSCLDAAQIREAGSPVGQGRWTCFWLCGWGAGRAHNPYYGPCPFHARKGMLQRFIFALFSKGPPATNRERPEGRGEGNEGSSAFHFPESC